MVHKPITIPPKSVSLEPVEAQPCLRASREFGFQKDWSATPSVLTKTGIACQFEAGKAMLEKHW
jgi:hypothetical protein